MPATSISATPAQWPTYAALPNCISSGVPVADSAVRFSSHLTRVQPILLGFSKGSSSLYSAARLAPFFAYMLQKTHWSCFRLKKTGKKTGTKSNNDNARTDADGAVLPAVVVQANDEWKAIGVTDMRVSRFVDALHTAFMDNCADKCPVHFVAGASDFKKNCRRTATPGARLLPLVLRMLLVTRLISQPLAPCSLTLPQLKGLLRPWHRVAC